MKNFLLMGSVMLAACSPYQEYNKSYIVEPGQKEVSLVLGEVRHVSLYHVVEPFNLTLKAPSGARIAYQGSYAKDTTLEINPRQKIAYRYEIEKYGKLTSVDFLLTTYQSPGPRPVNAVNLMRKSGKTTRKVGEVLSYRLGEEQKSTLIDLNEFDKYYEYEFNYIRFVPEGSPVRSIKINLIPPEGMSFIIGEEKKDSYSMDLLEGGPKSYTFKLQASTYVKELHLSFLYKRDKKQKNLKP